MDCIDNLYCVSSERSFAGCVVSSGGNALDHCPATEEDFFDPLARQIFQLAHALYTTGAPVNVRTVLRTFAGDTAERLQQLSAICYYPVPAQAPHFFEIINDKLTLRRSYDAVRWADTELRQTSSAKEFCAELHARWAGVDRTATSENLFEPVCQAIGDKLARMERGEEDRGIATWVSPWDNNFGGLMPGQLYALAGRPSTGKKALLEMLIAQCLKQGAPVSVFEKDMSPQKLIERMACRASVVQFGRLARGALHADEIAALRRALAGLAGSSLHLYNPGGLTAERLCQIARRDIRVHGVKAVFLDHIQALRVGRDFREGLTQASLALRANVTETNVPHVVLAHINRNGAKCRPTPEDIKEFDQLYGDCDGMMILWTAESRAEMAGETRMPTRFYTAKNRDGGISEDEMLFDGPTMTFHENPAGAAGAQPRAL